MGKHYYTIKEITPNVDQLYEEGIVRGKDVGFMCLKDLYTMKLGGTTYLYGSPYSGKTQFWFELLVNMSEFHGWKHAIYSPESGNKNEIAAELCSIYLRKPFYKNYQNYMSENEKYQALAWLNEHFFIIDPGDAEITMKDFYNEIDAIESDLGIKIHTSTLDPWNELKSTMEGSRQDLYLEDLLGTCRRNAQVRNRHNAIITHVSNQQPKEENGITYYPPATPRQIAGGEAWFRKGMCMLSIWRPPFGLAHRDGTPFEENETHVIISKSKPKGVGQKGTAKLFYDFKQNRYYERLTSGNIQYSQKLEPIVLAHNEAKTPYTTALTNEDPNNLPF